MWKQSSLKAVCLKLLRDCELKCRGLNVHAVSGQMQGKKLFPANVKQQAFWKISFRKFSLLLWAELTDMQWERTLHFSWKMRSTWEIKLSGFLPGIENC